MPSERKPKTCDPSWHWLEPHRKTIYQVAFNQVDASQADVFAVVGAKWVSIYRLPPAESLPRAETASAVAEKNGRKRKDRAAAAMGRLEPLQTYADDDTEESFYCVVWGADPSNGNAWLAVAGKRRQIRLIDCHRGVPMRTMRGHGGAVHEVRFVPHGQASLLLSASEDESVRLWCCSTAYCLAIFAGQRGHRDAVLSLDVRPDAAYLATAGVDGTVRTAWSLPGACMHTACTLHTCYMQVRVWSLRDEALQRRIAEAEAAAPCVAAAEAEAAAAAEVAAALKEAEEAAAAAADGCEEIEEIEEVEVEVEVDWAPRRTRHSPTPNQVGRDDGASADPPLPAAPAAPAATPMGRKRAKPRSVPRKGDSRGALEAARAAAQDAKGAAATAARAVHAAEERAARGFAPPARVQLPVATVEGLHFEGVEGVSYYVDCVRWVGQLLLTRGTDERAVLWAPPPLDGQRPSWRPASSSSSPPCTPFSAATPGAATPSSATSGFASSGPVAAARGSTRTPRSAPASGSGGRRPAAPAAAASRPAALPTLLNEWHMPASSLWFLRCSLDPARRLLALGSTQGCVAVCEVDAVRAPPLVRCLARRGGGRKRACALVTVRHTAFSSDASHLVGGCDDGSVYIWRLGSAVDDATDGNEQ